MQKALHHWLIKIRIIGTLSLAVLFTNHVTAQVNDEIVSNILAKLNITSAAVEKSPVDGLYKITLNNGSTLFTTKSAEYFLSGDMYVFKQGKLVNLALENIEKNRIELLAKVNKKDMIIYPAIGHTLSIIHVFTDVDCSYCRKFHYEIPELNGHGIEVRYLAYPRTGIYSPSFDKISTAWCSENRHQTLTKLQEDQVISLIDCEQNPVASQFKLGGLIGVIGTPSIVLNTGKLISGYQTTEQLLTALAIK